MDYELTDAVENTLTCSFKKQRNFYDIANKKYSKYLTASMELHKTRIVISGIAFSESHTDLFTVVQKLSHKAYIAERNFVTYCLLEFQPRWFTNTTRRQLTINVVKELLRDIHPHLVDFFIIYRHFTPNSSISRIPFTFQFGRMLGTSFRRTRERLRWLLFKSTNSYRPCTCTSKLLLTRSTARRDVFESIRLKFTCRLVALKILDFLYV